MSSGGLFAEIKKHPRILALVILVHLVVIVLLSINLASDEKPPMPKSQNHKIINAVAVDATKYDEQKKQKKLAAKKKVEDKKKADLKRKKALEKKRLSEKKKAAEKKKIVKKKAAEKKKQKELSIAKKKKSDKLAKEKKARERKAKEKKAQELKAKKKLEADKKRKIEEARIAEEKRRAEEKAEFERALLEEERREEEARRKAAYEAKLLTLRQKYGLKIAQKVENSWLRPATNSEGFSCGVRVTQTMTGDVIDVRLQSCVGDNAFKRSVERAVRKASPLPLPPNPDVFDRVIEFTFKPRH